MKFLTIAYTKSGTIFEKNLASFNIIGKWVGPGFTGRNHTHLAIET